MQISAHERLHSPQKGFQRPQTNIKRKTYPPPTHEPTQPQGLDLLPVLGTCGRARECLPAGAEHPARFCVLLSSNEKYAVGSFRNRTAEAPGFTFSTYTGAARPLHPSPRTRLWLLEGPRSDRTLTISQEG